MAGSLTLSDEVPLDVLRIATARLGLTPGCADSFFKHTASSPYGKTVNEAAAVVTSIPKKQAAAQKHHDVLAAKPATKAADFAATRAVKKAQKAAEEAASKKVRK